MEKNAVFSPCKTCKFRNWSKSDKHYVVDRNGNFLHWYKDSKKERLQPGWRLVKNQCYQCQRTEDYDDLLTELYRDIAYRSDFDIREGYPVDIYELREWSSRL